MAKNIIADREECVVYSLNGITYVPHYKTPSMYVGPAYHEVHCPIMYTPSELKLGGAKEGRMYLWSRPKLASDARI